MSNICLNVCIGPDPVPKKPKIKRRGSKLPTRLRKKPPNQSSEDVKIVSPAFVFKDGKKQTLLSAPQDKKKPGQNKPGEFVKKLAKPKSEKFKKKKSTGGSQTSGITFKKLTDVQKHSKVDDSMEVSQEFQFNHQKPPRFSLFHRNPRTPFTNTEHESVEPVHEEVFSSAGNTFANLGIHSHAVSNLKKLGFETLTYVQEKAIPEILQGKDTLVRSQTGSGKTLAYAIPIIDALQSLQPRLTRQDGVQALIIVPTRELALQTYELFSKLVYSYTWIVPGYLCGGEKRSSEKARLRKGINILIGTPGRLLDHMLHTKSFKVNSVRCLVIDEADRLIEMGYRKDINSLVEVLNEKTSTPDYDPMSLVKSTFPDGQKPLNKKIKFTEEEEEPSSSTSSGIAPLRDRNSKRRQNVLLSATLTKEVHDLVDLTMKSHIFIDCSSSEQTTSEGAPKVLVVPECVRQECLVVETVKAKLLTLCALILNKMRDDCKIFVFMASRQMVEFHADLLNRYFVKKPKFIGKEGVIEFDDSGDEVTNDDAEEDAGGEDDFERLLDVEIFKLHGSMDQKERTKVFKEFRTAKKGVLLCTDVAARGLDVPETDCTIQYTGPLSDEDYVHRAGRTGRAGHPGHSILFLTPEEMPYLNRLRQRKLNIGRLDQKRILKYLCRYMDEEDFQAACHALQQRFENAVTSEAELHRSACFAYSTWSRFYHTYPTEMRQYFNFKSAHLGHYVTSMALRETPQKIGRLVRGQVDNVEKPRLNKKLANHPGEEEEAQSKIRPSFEKVSDTDSGAPPAKKKKMSIFELTSEFSSGLPPTKKKKKNKE